VSGEIHHPDHRPTPNELWALSTNGPLPVIRASSSTMKEPGGRLLFFGVSKARPRPTDFSGPDQRPTPNGCQAFGPLPAIWSLSSWGPRWPVAPSETEFRSQRGKRGALSGHWHVRGQWPVAPHYFSVRRDSPSNPPPNSERIVGHRNADGQVRERLHISFWTPVTGMVSVAGCYFSWRSRRGREVRILERDKP
jgi:hypothetical protein